MSERTIGLSGDSAYLATSNGRETKQVQNTLPASTRELFWDLLRTPPWEIFNDAVEAGKDFGIGLAEKAKFNIHPIMQGRGLSRGNGEPVNLYGGLLTADWFYSDTKQALKSANYNVEIFNFRTILNVEPLDSLADQSIVSLERMANKYGKKVKGVGHSKGGLILAATYAKYPDRFEEAVDQVVFIGSPIPNWINKAVLAAYLHTQLIFRGDDMKIAGRRDEIQRLARRDRVEIGSIGTKDPIIRGDHIGSDHYYLPQKTHTALCHDTDSVSVLSSILSHDKSGLKNSRNISQNFPHAA